MAFGDEIGERRLQQEGREAPVVESALTVRPARSMGSTMKQRRQQELGESADIDDAAGAVHALDRRHGTALKTVFAVETSSITQLLAASVMSSRCSRSFRRMVMRRSSDSAKSQRTMPRQAQATLAKDLGPSARPAS